ncbi:MAG TPA: PLP-dependent aminotransferase family protein, partial [Sphingomonadaceae bacterium]|nr:PLP-dependent aminotransferase family protein [Sphingomonadaceae bacterium]
RVLSLAANHGMTIVEDDIFADFEPYPTPRLAVLDGLERVIRIGSFSKALSASARCGYIAARADWIEELADLQVATCFGGPSTLATELVAGILAGGGYRKYMEDLRQRLTRARKQAAERLAPLGITPWLMPPGGFHLWCRLPEGYDSGAIARRCMEDGIMLAPGNVFSVSQTAAGFARFNVTQLEDERVFTAMLRAMAEARNAREGKR